VSELLTTPELVREVAKEPAKRWFNWWRAEVYHISLMLDESGRETGEEAARNVGDVWRSMASFASKADAEARALYILRDADHEAISFDVPPLLTFLGAFPEGERPE